MLSVSSRVFGLAYLVLAAAVLTAIYLVVRIANLDSEVLVEQSYESYRIVHHDAEVHRAFVREWFWLMPALASFLSLVGWSEYFKSSPEERSSTTTVGGIVVTFLSASFLLGIGAMVAVGGRP